ncbi:sulfatase-like hydrolase/transferase [Aliifodinibius sp. S!AR15-10]|uniref:sulfatase-like hydrolase/transferase n=1 Tax=Aliifodinibius sp. S!AR15-10 TaxID=2950437 RepID=UPI00285D7A07|nr:sulfatase-like hydrolase/transferase [Aliifodinibius sp. S!AR15-10]MDR8392407.1 sulfatase-like hydrolase/transferase [Aliifodinibius sp. S!AR15-10]
MKDKIICLLVLLVLTASTATGQSETRRSVDRPNIIFIFIDDMGYGDISSFGNKLLETPNIDRLAEEGITLTNFYVASPICSPSRVAITTGQYPARWGVHSYLASSEKNRQREMANYLDPKAPSIARTMQKAGYATAHYGKWHMGGGRDIGDAPLPRAYGFDRSLVSFEGLGPRLLREGQGLSEQSAQLGQGPVHWVKKWEKTGIYVDSTLAFIDRHQKEPFYIHLWPGDVHDPFIPKPEWREKFREYDNNPYQRDFLATLWNLDHQVGRVLDRLDELDRADNTLVVFTSDNGPTDWPFYYEEYHWPPGSSGPFRGRKWSLYEGGIRMPFLARWPGHIPAGAVDVSTVMGATDLFKTICSLAGVQPSQVTFDGEDMSEVLLGKPQQRKAPLFWEYGREEFYLSPGNPRFQSPNLAVRDGKWKLLINADSTDAEFYNLKLDHAETQNLVDEMPDTARRLATELLEWRRSLP